MAVFGHFLGVRPAARVVTLAAGFAGSLIRGPALFHFPKESQIVIPPLSKAPHVPEAIAKPKAKTKMSEGRAVQASVPPSGALAQRGVSDDSFAFGAPQATRISV